MPIRLTKAVKRLLVTYLAVFIVQQTGDRFFGTNFLGWFGLAPSAFIFLHRYWQLFTYSFFHNDVMHLFFNGMILAFVGAELEMTWGVARFFKYYFVCATGAALFYLLCSFIFLNSFQQNIPLMGSSGALYGLLMAYGLMFGERVMLFMLLFPMKAKHFIWVIALLELLSSVYSPGRGFSGIASIGGMLSGLLYVSARIWLKARSVTQKLNINSNRSSQQRYRKLKSAHHLKLVINNAKDLMDNDDDSQDPKNNPKTWH